MISGSVVMDQFDYNQYIEECCNALEAAKQVSTDVQAAYMVRLQRIVDSISKAFPRGENPAVETRIRAPMYMAIKTLQNELYEFKKTWPDELQQNTILLLHYYSAEVFLYETIFLERIDGKSAPMERLHTLEILNNCLVAIKNYEEIYRTIPQSHYAYFPFTTWIQSGLVTQTACELCFYDHPGWELPYIRAQLDIPRFIQYEMNSIQSIINVRRTPEMGVANKDIFHRFLRRHINMKSAYESRLSSETEAQSSHAQGQENVTMSSTTPAAALLPSMEDIYMGGLYYDFDNAFWQDFGLGAGNWASLGTGTGTSMGTGAGLGQYAGA